MIIAGLDTSTKTGCLVLDGHKGEVLHASVLQAPKEEKGLTRAGTIAGQMMDVWEAHKPCLIAVEDYGFGNAHTLATLVEVGTVLRYFIKQA